MLVEIKRKFLSVFLGTILKIALRAYSEINTCRKNTEHTTDKRYGMSSYYYFGFLFILQLINALDAFPCHQCKSMIFNHSITIDEIPSPSHDDCTIITAESTCSVRISYFENGQSEVLYTSDLGLRADTISVQILRRVTTWSAAYDTRRYMIYTCQPSNSTPCNTDENLKRSIASTIFPSEERIQKFDTLIAPTTEFFGQQCYQNSNSTDCLESNFASCQQCWGILQYSAQTTFCGMCPAGKALTNFIEYTSTFYLDNQTRSDTITLGCRQFNACNSMENLDRIRKTLITQFDFNRFNTSTIPQLSFLLFFSILLRLIFI